MVESSEASALRRRTNLALRPPLDGSTAFQSQTIPSEEGGRSTTSDLPSHRLRLQRKQTQIRRMSACPCSVAALGRGQEGGRNSSCARGIRLPVDPRSCCRPTHFATPQPHPLAVRQQASHPLTETSLRRRFCVGYRCARVPEADEGQVLLDASGTLGMRIVFPPSVTVKM